MIKTTIGKTASSKQKSVQINGNHFQYQKTNVQQFKCLIMSFTPFDNAVKATKFNCTSSITKFVSIGTN